MDNNENRVGVFICKCGRNISNIVDVEKVRHEIEEKCSYVGVNEHVCSDNGQVAIIEKIEEEDLDGVVIAACSLSLHGDVFKNVMKKVGLNPSSLERINIREQCSWVHKDEPKKATDKAISLIYGSIKKLEGSKDIQIKKQRINKRVMVIGAGIAGITAALEIDSSNEVILMDKEPLIGGNTLRLTKLFPTFDCAQCVLSPKMVDVSQRLNVRILTNSRIEDITGSSGRYKVKIKQEPRHVDEKKCFACGKCELVCPVEVPDEFNLGLKKRKAIYLPHPQAIPRLYQVDTRNCIQNCKKCLDICRGNAIDLNEEERTLEFEVGAILLATGYQLFDVSKLGQYKYGVYPDVITSLELERLIALDGPTEGRVLRPSDMKVPNKIAFIQCVGSRDLHRGMSYCSRICCMHAMKQAQLLKDILDDSSIWIFYTDIRAAGKGYEEFYIDTQKKGIIFNRGRVSEIIKENDELILRAENTLFGSLVEQ